MAVFVYRIRHVFLLIFFMNAARFTQSMDEAEIEERRQMNEETNSNSEEEGGRGSNVKTLRFKAANLTEEDQYSQHMPSDLRCDSCRIIAYVITKQLKRIQDRYRKGHKLSEPDVVDIIDNVCENENEIFNSYGIKDVDGQRRLSGDGLETKDLPGILQGGGKWPYRLQQLCAGYVDFLGEDKIYDYFLADDSVEDLMCRNKMEGFGIACVPKQGEKKPSSKKAKEDL